MRTAALSSCFAALGLALVVGATTARAAKPKKPKAAPATAAAADATPAADAPVPADAPPTAATPDSAPAPAAAAPSTGAAVAPATAAVEVRDFSAAEVAVKMKDTGERVSELKEKVFRTKARLVLLQETILGTGLSAARATIIHRNEMGAAFKLEKLSYAIDGSVVYSKGDAGEIAKRDEIEIWTGNVTPGNHQVSVEMVYRGHGFGVFSYLNKYTFKVKSSYTFHAEEGKFTRVKVVGYEKEGWTLPIEEKPTVRYDVEVLSDEGAEIVDKK
ncbi:MAG TPA: dihydrolipoamide acetyltransferase [Myxococcota bacterium]|nr:dihydrolipoamide acetyltransferase [Myxococcota bacterium]